MIILLSRTRLAVTDGYERAVSRLRHSSCAVNINPLAWTSKSLFSWAFSCFFTVLEILVVLDMHTLKDEPNVFAHCLNVHIDIGFVIKKDNDVPRHVRLVPDSL